MGGILVLALQYIDAVSVVRAFYLLSMIAILLVRLIPALGDRFLSYGARGATKTTSTSTSTSATSLSCGLDQLAALRVPHSAFWHFYALSIICTSVCIAAVVWQPGALQSLLLPRKDSSSSNGQKVSSFATVVLCLFLLGFQGVRRLWECISLSRESSSSMWIGHYLIGMAFYVFANAGIVVEHLETLTTTTTTAATSAGMAITPIQIAALVGFVVASWKQHVYHFYLANLKKYTLPTEEAFKSIVAPHYTAECVIYLALAVLSAPPQPVPAYGTSSSSSSSLVNVTILCALTFVIVNLGITAEGTKRWMMDKFSDNRGEIEKRWRMIPGLF